MKKNFGNERANLPLNDICASFQKAVVSSLVEKTMIAAKGFKIKTIAVSGGVSANSRLRKEFIKFEKDGFKIQFPEKIYSTDNAAMIGYYGYLKYKHSTNINLESELLDHAFARFEY